MKQTCSFFILALFLAAQASSCGYHLAGRGELPLGVTRISVEMFKNQTSQEDAGRIFSNALIQEMLKYTHVDVVSNSTAQASVSGVVRSVAMDTLTRSSDDSVVERRMTVVLDIEMLDDGGDVIWSQKGFFHQDEYRVSQVNVTDEEAKMKVLEMIAQRVAQRIVSLMTDNF